MKILHVVTDNTFNIYYRTISDLISLFNNQNIDQKIVCNNKNLRHIFDSKQFIFIPFIKNIFGFNTKLLLNTNKFVPDIIITWDLLSRDFIGSTKYLHISFVDSINSMNSFSVCDYIFTNSEKILNFLKTNQWSGDRSFYIPQFVRNTDNTTIITKKDLYIPERSKVIFSACGFYNISKLEPLFTSLLPIQEIYLIIAGHGPNIKEAIELATKIGIKPRLRIINQIDNLESLLNISEFSVFPFFDIEIQKSILSSFQNKKLVITEKNYLTSEIIQDKENGIMLYSTESKNITDIIQKNLIDKSLTNLIDTAYNYYLKHSEDIIVKQYKDIFEKLVCEYNIKQII